MAPKFVGSLALAAALVVGTFAGPAAQAVEGGLVIDQNDLQGEFAALALVQLAAGSCSGALVADDLVLTAAHCEDPVSVQVNGGTYAVTATHVAPGYDPANFSSEHDLALLRLDAAVPAQPLSFAFAAFNDVPVDGEGVLFAGFGNEGSVDSAALGFGEVGTVTARTFDVSGDSKGCAGDSGGPVLLNGAVVGVISAGIGGTDCFDVTTATRVSAQIDFLAGFVNIEPVVANGSATILPGGKTTLTLRAQDTAGEQIRFAVIDDDIFTAGRGCSATDAAPDASTKCTISAPKGVPVGTTGFVGYTASDGRATSTGFFEVTVQGRSSGSGGRNTAPIARDLAVEVGALDRVEFELPVFDAEGDVLTTQIRTQPTAGQVGCGEGSCGYVSEASEFGVVDSFTYTVSDGKRTSNTATVTITTIDNRAPVFLDPGRTINGYSGTTVYDRILVQDAQRDPVVLTAAEPTFSNDTGTVEFSCFNDHGVSTQQRVECFVKVSPGFSGRASFILNATDGTSTATDTYTVDVQQNRAPSIFGETFTLDDDGSPEDFQFRLVSFGDNPDPDCAEAVAAFEEGSVECAPLVYTIDADTSAANGTFSCNTDPASEFNGSCTYSPAEGATGNQVVTIRWSVSDGALSSRTVTTMVTFRLSP